MKVFIIKGSDLKINELVSLYCYSFFELFSNSSVREKVLQKYLKIILLHDPRPAPPCGALESVSSPRKPSARENFDLEEKFRFVSRWRPKFVPSEGE